MKRLIAILLLLPQLALGQSLTRSHSAFRRSTRPAIGKAAGGAPGVVFGGTGPLLPANPQFDTTITATTAQNGWWKSTGVPPGGGSASVTTPYATALMTGGNAARLYVTSTGAPTYGSAALFYRFTRAELEAMGGRLTFDVYPVTPSGAWSSTGAGSTLPGNNISLWMQLQLQDSTATAVTDSAQSNSTLDIAGYTWTGSGGTVPLAGNERADRTTVFRAVSGGNKYTVTIDAKTWLSTRFLSGKSWADVAYLMLRVSMNTGSYDGNSLVTGEVLVDNFR